MTYQGKLIRVHLKEKKIIIEPLNMEFAQHFLGGRGLGVKLLYDELLPGIEPLGENNKIALMTGPMTGTNSITSSRWSMVFKSPLTEYTLNDTHCGGKLGIELKRAGFDGIIIEGISDGPVYLKVKDEEVTLEDASELWGKPIDETEAILRFRHPQHSIAAIGPAGENLVRYACVKNGPRTAGRGGVGAVWGSKKLKAIIVHGTKPVTIANPFAYRQANKEFAKVLKGHPVTGTGMRRYGTLILANLVNKHGALPVKNFQAGVFEGIREVAGETVREYLKKIEPCRACSIGCGRVSSYEGVETEGPEFETVWAFGPNCQISNLKHIFEANELCNTLGLDTISTGNAIGWYMECGERGLVSNAPQFGDGEKLLALVRKIAYREDEGNLLADGVRKAAQEIGHDSGDFAIHVKGLEMPAYDPRGIRGMALSYATSTSGATHLRAYTIIQEVLSLPHFVDPFTDDGKAELVRKMQDIFAVLDSAEFCKFTTMATFSTLELEIDLFARLLTTATGFFIDVKEFKKIGERIYNLERLFNLREGLTRLDDSLPKRFLVEPLDQGPAKGLLADIDALLSEYYRLRGWDELGVPSERKLEELSLKPLRTAAKLQVALDLRDTEEAIKIAKRSALGGVDWIEAGTPLIKAVGMGIITQLRQLFPHKVIVADLKTMDTGFLETEMAALAGADIVCILGIAPDETLEDAVGAGEKFGVKIFADLIGVKNPIERAIQLEKIGV
ncbi:MAG: orotidine 5'-phosphate decarboxylase / HUMPS family protein, partial [Candidatus Heimdallarchaeota archaeon]